MLARQYEHICADHDASDRRIVPESHRIARIRLGFSVSVLGVKGRTEHCGPASYKSRTVLELATMRHGRTLVRVLIGDLERHQLRLLRAGLGLDPPPAAKQHTGSRKAAGSAGVPGTDLRDIPVTYGPSAAPGDGRARRASHTVDHHRRWMLSRQPRGGSE